MVSLIHAATMAHQKAYELARQAARLIRRR
jgi:hypothetical protein